MVVHKYCKLLFLIFHLFFHMDIIFHIYVVSVHLDVAYDCMVSSFFICFHKCFVRMLSVLSVFMLQVCLSGCYVSHIYYKCSI
jgi:hypothetical protein